MKKAKRKPASLTVRAEALHAWLGVVRTYNLCNLLLSSRLAALQLRVPEHEVLVNLLLLPGMTQQQLAERCFVAKSGMSMLLRRMERRMLIRREANDQDLRCKRLFLQSNGQATAQRAVAIQNEIVGAMAAQLTASELAALKAMMQRVSSKLEQLGGHTSHHI
jgi:DNA-binding MarR family transcriptional regulator